MLNVFSRQLINEMQQHALAAYPKISVGIVSGWNYYRIGETDVIKLERGYSFDFHYKTDIYNHKHQINMLRFVVFSRPNLPAFPNAREMVEQLTSDAPWIYLHTEGVDCTDPIIWGKGAPFFPYVGRPFRHGVSDCYSLIRDYYWHEHRIFLDEYPRDWFWWANAAEDAEYRSAFLPEPVDMYSDNFRHQGFTPFDNIGDLKAGDSLLFALNSPMVNHAVVYLGNDKILHHVSSAMPVDYRRISRIDNLSQWLKRYNATPVRHKLLHQE